MSVDCFGDESNVCAQQLFVINQFRDDSSQLINTNRQNDSNERLFVSFNHNLVRLDIRSRRGCFRTGCASHRSDPIETVTKMSTKRLYESCVTIVSKSEVVAHETDSLKFLPTNVLFDVLYQMSTNGNYYYLENYFIDFDIISRFLVELKERRNSMHYMFQSLMDSDLSIGRKIVNRYIDWCTPSTPQTTATSLSTRPADRMTKLKFGLNFGTFLKESGWYDLSADVFRQAIGLYDKSELRADSNLLKVIFECNWKLLSALNAFCYFDAALTQMNRIQEMIADFDMRCHSSRYNLSQVYAEFAQLFFFQSFYNDSYNWAVASIQNLAPQTPIFTVIDVYRQAAKTAVVKREFRRAETLINQAMILCKETFRVTEDQSKYVIGIIHLKLADVLLDYGFYLLNVDSIAHSVKLYEMALEIREYIFGLNDNSVTNLLIAMTHEELGYASYVHEYSSGNFLTASFHANKAMTIVTQLLPEDHLLLASAKRVKALILEEIAIDHHDKKEERRMLELSRELHLSALEMARKAFGEVNVQTAKHYGNLGRLYQSMKRYEEAEAMHLKAIEIKEQLLGPNDYEVALSLGHLASLYNYDMHLFHKAEHLYLRSVDIGIKLFGHGYSGLEYDYRGLVRVYHYTKNDEKHLIYSHKLLDWKRMRDTILETVRDSPPIKGLNTMQKLSPQEVITLIETQSN